ncbi:hypothetical protein ACPCI1_23735 [Streptomyces seoulensis]|uniref:hypothetical protein n=1 Tax=Streptomyces seoulensis TaxID=73044 RepID=UPI003C2F4616
MSVWVCCAYGTRRSSSPLYWADEIRTPTSETAPGPAAVSATEIDSAFDLIIAMTRENLEGVDSTIVRARQHAAGGKRGPSTGTKRVITPSAVTVAD